MENLLNKNDFTMKIQSNNEFTFNSPTFGRISKEKVFNFIKNEVSQKKGQYKIVVGTDSQNTYKTKMVIVICLIRVGNGGQFFYRVDWLPKIRDLNTKIYTETERSLEIAKELNDFLHKNGIRAEVEIHIDIGTEGKTKALIQSILGWISSEGFIAKIKDESYVASTIADRISK